MITHKLPLFSQEVINAITQGQASAGGLTIGNISSQNADTSIALSRVVTVPELRRHKRAFIKLATQNNWTRLQNAQDAKNMFMEYLSNNIQ